MATDGFWDVISNDSVRDIVSKIAKKPEVDIAAELVRTARGTRVPDGCWEMATGDLSSGDDISVLVVSLAKAKR